jgi:hypothetical protein
MIENILETLSPGKAFLGLLAFLTILFWARKLQVSRQVARLGARAPEIPTYLPIGECLEQLCSFAWYQFLSPNHMTVMAYGYVLTPYHTFSTSTTHQAPH